MISLLVVREICIDNWFSLRMHVSPKTLWTVTPTGHGRGFAWVYPQIGSLRSSGPGQFLESYEGTRTFFLSFFVFGRPKDSARLLGESCWQTNEGPLVKKDLQKSKNSRSVSGRSVGAEGVVMKGANWRSPGTKWCGRCLLITKRPKAPIHYRYLNLGPRLHSLYGIGSVQFCDYSCSCVYCDFEFLKFVLSTLRSRSCFNNN